MKWVKPEVFLIAKTVVQNNGVMQWLRCIGCDEKVVAKYGQENYLGDLDVTHHVKTDAERLIELAGRRCYLSFEPGLNPNVKKIREDITDYLTNILKSGHGSVLAHATFTFAIEGVSRVFTGEMNRHSVGTAISEGSMRYIRYNDIPIVDVPSIQKLKDENSSGSYMSERNYTRNLIQTLCITIEQTYRAMVSTWQPVLEGKEFAGKKHITSMLRRIIPMGVATGGVWTFNVRSLRHMLTMRAAEAAEEEIALVAGKILEIMMAEEPVLFGDFKMQENGFYKPEYVKV